MDVLVGVGVIVRRDGKVLLGLRKGSHGAATWGLPGGHLEAGESVEACAVREALEETGLRIGEVAQAGFSSDVFTEVDRHYVTLFVEADVASGVLEVREPGRCEAWQWFEWNDLPEPLFAPLSSFMRRGGRPVGLLSTRSRP